MAYFSALYLPLPVEKEHNREEHQDSRSRGRITSPGPPDCEAGEISLTFLLSIRTELSNSPHFSCCIVRSHDWIVRYLKALNQLQALFIGE